MADDTETPEAHPAPNPAQFQETISSILTILVIILVITTPCLSCSLYYLSTVPDVTWQRGSRDLTIDRIRMVDVRGPIGIAYETHRVDDVIDNEQVCVTSRVRYFLWRTPKEAIENASFSQLYRATEAGWQATTEPCPQ